MKTAFVLQWANLQCVSDSSLQLRICCCSGASSYFPFVAERQYSSSKTVGLFDVVACVCVFIHLVCPEFCLWSNIYFLFPALLANDNLIHPGESCGGSWGEEQRMRGQKGSRTRRAVKQCCVNIFRWNDQISPNSRSFTSLTGHVSASMLCHYLCVQLLRTQCCLSILFKLALSLPHLHMHAKRASYWRRGGNGNGLKSTQREKKREREAECCTKRG